VTVAAPDRESLEGLGLRLRARLHGALPPKRSLLAHDHWAKVNHQSRPREGVLESFTYGFCHQTPRMIRYGDFKVSIHEISSILGRDAFARLMPVLNLAAPFHQKCAPGRHLYLQFLGWSRRGRGWD
jgi:hypothetical protein